MEKCNKSYKHNPTICHFILENLAVCLMIYLSNNLCHQLSVNNEIISRQIKLTVQSQTAIDEKYTLAPLLPYKPFKIQKCENDGITIGPKKLSVQNTDCAAIKITF